MSDKSSFTENVLVRRRFIASAVATGMGAVCATKVLAGVETIEPRETCGELTAADPLYLYATLVSQLQPAAIIAARGEENVARQNLSQKLKEVWTVADELRLKLSPQSKLHPAVDRVTTMARIGRTNSRAMGETRRSQSPKLNHANIATQQLITREIVDAATALSAQGAKTLTAEEWDLLQRLLALIQDIKTIHQPAAVEAGIKFDKFISSVSTSVLGIQAALMDASRHVVLGEKAQAQTKIKEALAELRKLPNAPKTNQTSEELTRDGFIALIEPILKLLSGGQQRAPQVSHHSHRVPAATSLALMTPDMIFLHHTALEASTVKAVVREFFKSGNWWQVVGVTAACLPLWSAYNQTAQRYSLIRSAISAVPRGRGSDLDGAANALNRLL